MRTQGIFAIFLSVVGVSTTNSSQSCKCIPGETCWPSQADFASLNKTLAGRLIQGIPPGSVCYTSQPNYNISACETVLRSWFSSTFHASNPISIGWPWWANNPCPPIFPNGTSVTGDQQAGTKGCTIGSYPVYAVNATEAKHVKAAVNFARLKNIRLNVKSTGHSFQGRSTGFGTISIWTHNMRGIKWHDDFKPDSCSLKSPQMAATIAAGERVRDVYTAAASHNAIVVAGSAQDVGIMGWFSGGGHGPLSSTYGLGVDNVLQAKLITPSGDLLTLNPCLNSDLFWAIRGGGGSTFGVLTEVTMKAYPSPRTSRHRLVLALANPENETGYWDLLAYILSESPRLKAGGLQGYGSINPPVPGVPSSTWTLYWGLNVYDKPNGTIESLFAPIKKKLDLENGTTIIYSSSVMNFPDFFTAWNASVTNEAVATAGISMGSRLIPAAPLTQDRQHLARVLRNLTMAAEGEPPAGMLPCFVANNQTGLKGDVSVTPAWRDAVAHVMVGEDFRDSATFAEAKPLIDRVTYERVGALKNLAPESGAYFNEADPFDPDWQYNFWGDNYPRLRAIKKRIDPSGLLWCFSCVGSEDWAQTGSGQLCPKP
ncbi:hypothetical protein B0J11DRAFT_588690 [Dendryphion nanum]|uniref:FAD-binding PCMH-type domain-containing protein n=1 Tax=Dendryphion nanum TaxID=256645 RepID=A0A9P9EJY5_9PLEO|nr:hypothetical protein B0J11DRAFT_588690 [Dendryphion nanum]